MSGTFDTAAITRVQAHVLIAERDAALADAARLRERLAAVEALVDSAENPGCGHSVASFGPKVSVAAIRSALGGSS